MKKPKYILIIDPRDEVLSAQAKATKAFYQGEIITWDAARDDLTSLEEKGLPELIIINHKSFLENEAQFYKTIEASANYTPFLIFSDQQIDESLKKDFPYVVAAQVRPLDLESYSRFVKAVIGHSLHKNYVPVSASVLLRVGVGEFDLFLKLSETNFVKIIHKGEEFSESDAKKLKDKGIHELYIRQDESEAFLKLLEVRSVSEVEGPTLLIENLEALEEVSKALGWSSEVMKSAEKSVTEAVRILSKSSHILNILKGRLSNPSSSYSRHIGFLSYLVCAFSSTLGWIGEAGQVKLAMAALIHDVALDEKMYEDIKEWNKRAADPTDRTAETIRYRMHPYEASKLIRSLDSFSPDVDQIILQHHECRSGKGFPRGLDHAHIGHLPAMFIIVEELVRFIDNGDNLETSITDFLTWGRNHFDAGHFKKIFDGFQEKLKN